MKMHINTFLEIRALKKEELELRKLKKTKSYLKEDTSLNKWLNSQISKRESAVRELRMSEDSKYIKESNGN